MTAVKVAVIMSIPSLSCTRSREIFTTPPDYCKEMMWRGRDGSNSPARSTGTSEASNDCPNQHQKC